MNTLIDYILKVNIALLVIVVFYLLFLRKLTFGLWKRMYLLVYALISMLLPIANIDFSKKQSIISNTEWLQYIPKVSVNEVHHQSYNIVGFLMIVLGIGCLIAFGKFLIRLLSIYRMQQSAALISIHGFKIFKLTAHANPFSFGNSIFVNPNMHEETELIKIIKHEEAHVLQKHSIDILFFEIINCFFWYNPASWLLKKLASENLEFLADESVIQSGVNKADYQLVLVKESTAAHENSVLHFNFLSLKSRIIMMNKLKSTKKSLIRFTFILPILFVLLVSFSSHKFSEEINAIGNKVADAAKQIYNTDTIPEKNEVSIIKITPTKASADKKEHRPPMLILNGRKEVSESELSEMDPNSIESIVVLKDKEAEKIYNVKDREGVILISTKDSLKAAAPKIVINSKENEDNIFALNNPTSAKPIFVLDGKIIDTTEFKKISPKQIKSISVLKGNSATALYGDKGANGVIEITSK